MKNVNSKDVAAMGCTVAAGFFANPKCDVAITDSLAIQATIMEMVHHVGEALKKEGYVIENENRCFELCDDGDFGARLEEIR